MRSVSLIWHLFALKLKREMMFKVSFWLQVVSRASYIVVTALFFEVVYRHVERIGGFSHDEMLILVGTTGITISLFRTLFRAVTWRLGRLIRYGGIEFIMTKPVDLKLFAAACEPDPSELMGIPIPLALVVAGAKSASYSLLRWAGWLSGILLGIVLFLELMLTVNALRFRFVRMRAMVWILEDFLAFTRFPFTVYPAWLRAVLTVVVPVFFVSNFPVMLLTGRIGPGWMLLGAAIALAWWRIVNRAWEAGLRSYEGAATVE